MCRLELSYRWFFFFLFFLFAFCFFGALSDPCCSFWFLSERFSEANHVCKIIALEGFGHSLFLVITFCRPGEVHIIPVGPTECVPCAVRAVV